VREFAHRVRTRREATVTDEPITEQPQDSDPEQIEDLTVDAADAEGVVGGDNFPDVPDNHLKI
jgi:hypothetical protein